MVAVIYRFDTECNTTLAPWPGGAEETAHYLLGRGLQQRRSVLHGLFEGHWAVTKAKDGVDADVVQIADALADPAGDGHAGDTPRPGSLGDPGRRLAESGLEVDLALGSKHQIGTLESLVQTDEIKDQVDTAP